MSWVWLRKKRWRNLETLFWCRLSCHTFVNNIHVNKVILELSHSLWCFFTLEWISLNNILTNVGNFHLYSSLTCQQPVIWPIRLWYHGLVSRMGSIKTKYTVSVTSFSPLGHAHFASLANFLFVSLHSAVHRLRSSLLNTRHWKRYRSRCRGKQRIAKKRPWQGHFEKLCVKFLDK